MTKLVIPWASLSEEALDGVIQDFVTRDGTDYGDREVPLATRAAQVRRQLAAGKAVVVFDSELDSASIVPAEQVEGLSGDDPGAGTRR